MYKNLTVIRDPDPGEKFLTKLMINEAKSMWILIFLKLQIFLLESAFRPNEENDVTSFAFLQWFGVQYLREIGLVTKEIAKDPRTLYSDLIRVDFSCSSSTFNFFP